MNQCRVHYTSFNTMVCGTNQCSTRAMPRLRQQFGLYNHFFLLLTCSSYNCLVNRIKPDFQIRKKRKHCLQVKKANGSACCWCNACDEYVSYIRLKFKCTKAFTWHRMKCESREICMCMNCILSSNAPFEKKHTLQRKTRKRVSYKNRTGKNL